MSDLAPQILCLRHPARCEQDNVRLQLPIVLNIVIAGLFVVIMVVIFSSMWGNERMGGRSGEHSAAGKKG
jgi:hypothetical protein